MSEMDYSKLLGRVKEKALTQKGLAEKIGVSEGQLCHKLAGHYPFKQSEIAKICNVLDISKTEVGVFFFTEKVEISQ